MLHISDISVYTHFGKVFAHDVEEVFGLEESGLVAVSVGDCEQQGKKYVVGDNFTDDRVHLSFLHPCCSHSNQSCLVGREKFHFLCP